MSCFRHRDIRAKTLCRMTTATTFSRQNDAGSHAYTTYYLENLVLVVVLVLESQGLRYALTLSDLHCLASLLL